MGLVPLVAPCKLMMSGWTHKSMLFTWSAINVLVLGSIKSSEGAKGTLSAVRLGSSEEGSEPRTG